MKALIAMARFECRIPETNTYKFWEYEYYGGAKCLVRWGRIGTAGQEKEFSYTEDELASKIQEKYYKGYVQVNAEQYNKNYIEEKDYYTKCYITDGNDVSDVGFTDTDYQTAIKAIPTTTGNRKLPQPKAKEPEKPTTTPSRRVFRLD
jgi:predicted DNA-binding WGR domain protein